MNGFDQTVQPEAAWRVFVVAGSAISSEGMAAILRRDSRIELCITTGHAQSVEKTVAANCPDIVIIEPAMDKPDGCRLVKAIATRCPATRSLVVSEHLERVYAECAFRAGASGYFRKVASAADFLHAVEVVISNESRRAGKGRAPQTYQSIDRGLTTHTDLGGLSDREVEVFALLASGYGIGRIATSLGISRKTVETHCEHIKLKLGYCDAKELKVGAQELLGPGREK